MRLRTFAITAFFQSSKLSINHQKLYHIARLRALEKMRGFPRFFNGGDWSAGL
jgi:hypothetical protein